MISYDRLESAEAHLFQDTVDMVEDIIHNLENDELKKLIDSLISPKESRLLELQYGKGLSFKQIGKILEITEKVAGKRHFRIINKLKQKLSKRGIAI